MKSASGNGSRNRVCIRVDDTRLHQKDSEFLQDVISQCRQILDDRLVSVILFGSVIKGGVAKGVSDFDMILVIDDTVSVTQVYEVESAVSTVMRVHGMVGPSSMEFKGIPTFMMRESGMFMSSFICRESDLLSGNFIKTFRANSLLARLLVPAGIVFRSALNESRVVYGRDLVSRVQMPRPSIADILKSLLMNELLVVLSLFYHPFTPNATKIAMEASKWSVYTASFLMTGEARSLFASVAILSREAIATDHTQRLLKLRKSYRRDLSFAVSALKAIAQIHFFLLDNRALLSGLELEGDKRCL